MKNIVFTACLSLVLFSLPQALQAEVSTEVPNLAPGESITFTYRVRVNASNTLPPSPVLLSNQGTVSTDSTSELLTDDPSVSGSSDPTRVTVIVRDADADGIGDDVDQCPSDASKASPGACGCGSPDSDDNENEVADCLVNEDISVLLSSAFDLVKKMKPNSRLKNKKQRKAQRLRKKELRQLRNQLNQSLLNSLDVLILTEVNINLRNLNKKAFRALKGVLRTGTPTFGKKKKLARKAVRRLQNAIQ